MATRVSATPMAHVVSQADRNEAEMISAFLTKMLRNFEEITGRHVPTPPVLVVENLERNAIYFPHDGPPQGILSVNSGITLNPDYQRVVRHEAVHISRHVNLNAFNHPAGEVGMVLCAIEEGLADLLSTFGTLTRNGGMEHTEKAFKRYKLRNPSIFEVAAEIQGALARGGDVALYEYASHFPFGTERLSNGSILAGHDVYRMGAGLSANVFAINGFSADRTAKIALTKTGKQILTGIRRATELDPQWIANDLEGIRRRVEGTDLTLGNYVDTGSRIGTLVSSKV